MTEFEEEFNNAIFGRGWTDIKNQEFAFQISNRVARISTALETQHDFVV
jgi:hypothetical protein